MTTESERDLRDAWRLLSLAARLVQRRQDDVLAPLGLTRAAVITLEGLTAGALNQEQLAAAIHVKSQTVGKILARLQIAGLVSRTRHPQDRRQLIIGLTDSGHAALMAARGRDIEAFPPDPEVQGWMTLRRELAKFIKAVQALEPDGIPVPPAGLPRSPILAVGDEGGKYRHRAPPAESG